MGITRYFDDDERIAAQPDVEGIRGTGWVLSPQSMGTVKHAAAAMNLSDQSWKQDQIRNGESTQSIACASISRSASAGVSAVSSS